MKQTKYLIPLVVLFLFSCKKENFKPTLVYATITKGHDYMPHSAAEGCYPGDWYADYDTVFVYSSNIPDTNNLKIKYLSWFQEVPTGRVDSSFVFAGQAVTLTGPIMSREYRKVKINKIVYGSTD